MFTDSPFALTNGVILTIPDPQPRTGGASVAVQLQNASPFVLTVLAGIDQLSIQAFTAQTVAMPGDGSSLIVTPTGLVNAGTQGELVVSWLLAGESPPMQDGQLTGSAQYALGLASLVYTKAAFVSSVPDTFTIPPTARTLIVQVTPSTPAALSQLLVYDNASGIEYFNGIPYLGFKSFSAAWASSWAVVPLVPVLSPTLKINMSFGPTSAAVNVYADSALYDESVFYTGVPVPNTTTTTGATIVTGPCRVLSVDCNAAAGATAAALLNGSELTSGGIVGYGLPQPFIVPTGSSITSLISGGAGRVSCSSAYP